MEGQLTDRVSKASSAGRLALLVLTIAVLAVALLPSAAAAARKPVKGPKGLAFYKPPKKLPKGHGKLIWHRKAPNLVAASDHARTDKVLYTSKSPQRKRVAVSGSVSVPKGKPPKRGWPVITWDHGTTGIADVCAPSRAEDGTGIRTVHRHVGQGRLCGRAHRLPGPRHAGRSPLPDRQGGSAQRPRHHRRRPPVASPDRQEVRDRRSLAGRPRSAVDGRLREASGRRA